MHCNHPLCACTCLNSWRTWPNLITLLRTLGAVACAMAGLATRQHWLLFTAYGVYAVGDILDGNAARLLGQETRDGALFDIISDRLCAIPIFLGWAATEPHTALAIGVWLVGFAGIDLALSLGFRAWNLRGVGGFAVIDPVLYRWNFSPLAKAANSSVFIALIVVFPTSIPALGVALLVLALKSWSLRRLVRQLPSAHELPCIGAVAADPVMRAA